jgi:hypothetical protein
MHTSAIRTERSKVFVDYFGSALFIYEIKKKNEHPDTSVFATTTTLNAPLLSRVFDISRGPSIGTVQLQQLYCICEAVTFNLRTFCNIVTSYYCKYSGLVGPVAQLV